MPIQLEIVTPEKSVFSDMVDSVVLPGVDGELGVLPAHAPLVTTLKPGELRYMKNGEEHEFAVGEGLLEVLPDKVAVLTDLAVQDAEIDEAVVEEALARAQKSLEEKLGDEEVAAVQASIQKSLVLLHLKRKRRRQV